MKIIKITILMLLYMINGNLFADQKQNTLMTFNNLNEAITLAKQLNKHVIIDFYTDWCVPCKRMDQEVLKNPKTAEALGDRFILAQINAEKNEGIGLAQKFQIQAYPTFIVVDKNQIEVGRLTGAQPINLFIENVNKTIDNSRTNEQIIKRYEANERSPELINDYVLLQMKKGDEENGFKIIDDYYSGLSASEKMSSANWFIFNRYTIDRHHQRIKDLFNKQDQYRQSLGNEAIDEFFIKMIRRDLMHFVTSNADFTTETANQLFNSVKQFIDEARISKHPEIVPLFKIANARKNNMDKSAFLDLLNVELPNLSTIQVLLQIEKFKPDHGKDSVLVNQKQIDLLEKYIPQQASYSQRKLNYLLAVLKNVGNANGVSFNHFPVEEALKKAAVKKQLIFIDVYATWCGPCKELDAQVFSQAKVGDFINSNFIPIKLDGESAEGKIILKKYGINAYPTLLVLDSSGKEITRIVGVLTADQLIEKLRFK
ncbi:thioredoxin family protein [Sphingobacterium kyonggiense]